MPDQPPKFLVSLLIRVEVEAPNEEMAKDYVAVSLNHTIEMGPKIKEMKIHATELQASKIVTPYSRDGVKLL